MTEWVKDLITINGEEVPVRIGEIDQGSLRYYPENPRIYSVVAADGGIPNQEEIEEQLTGLEHVKVLYQSIKANGGLTDPLIVRDGDMVVLEGNSRLAAYRALARTDKVKWGKVKCKVLPQDIKESLIFSLLGQYHIIGRTDWAPYEQAGYLYRRHEKHGTNVEIMADEMGLNRGEVRRLIKVYTFMVKHKENETDRWSYYDEYLKHNTIHKAREKYPNLDDLVVKKIRNHEIEKAVDIREKLTKIAAIPKALASFVAGKADFEESVEIAIRRGADNTLYHRFNRFRKQIATEGLATEIKEMPHNQKAKCVFELKKIKQGVSDILAKADD